jgi:hypothetical protein
LRAQLEKYSNVACLYIAVPSLLLLTEVEKESSDRD